LEERCENCEHFHRLKHNFEAGTGFEESNCCDILLHLPDSTDDIKPWVQEVSRLGMCEMFTEVKQDKPTTKKDLAVDCISREEVIDYLCKHCPDDGECFKDCDEIKHLRQLPSVTPQEPKLFSIAEIKYDKDKLKELANKAVFTVTPQEPITWIVGKNNAQIAVRNMPIDKLQKICAIIGDEQESVLDKVRAEITENIEFNKKMNYMGIVSGLALANDVIDKYKAAVEPQESEG
jgi:hypothetical protein